jgi:hypothetical protein
MTAECELQTVDFFKRGCKETKFAEIGKGKMTWMKEM